MTIDSNTIFNDVVGQAGAKDQLAFHLEGYSATGIFPNVLLLAEKGGGKTTIARAVGRHLISKTTNQPKKFLEVNCSSIENNTHFFDGFVMPHILDREVTVFFDECSELPMSTQMALLSITDVKKDPVTKYFWNGTDIFFDFRQISFIFATTEAQKVFHALKNRLDKVEFDRYSIEELGIIAKREFEADVEPDVLNKIAECSRANARTAGMLGKKINGYLLARRKKKLLTRDWDEIQRRLRIYPKGLTITEVSALRALSSYKETPLKQLAAKLGMTPEMVQKEIELTLVREDLIEIGQRGRVLSNGGIRYLAELKKLAL